MLSCLLIGVRWLCALLGFLRYCFRVRVLVIVLVGGCLDCCFISLCFGLFGCCGWFYCLAWFGLTWVFVFICFSLVAVLALVAGIWFLLLLFIAARLCVCV